MKISKKFLIEATNTGDVFQKPIEQQDDLGDLVNKSKEKGTLADAILSDNLENVKRAIKNGNKITTQSFDYAILRDNPIPEIVEYIAKYSPVKDSQMLVKGLKTKKQNVVDAIIKAGIKPDPKQRTLDYGIMTNNNEIVKLLLKNGDKISPLSLYIAITMGNPEIVKTIVNLGRVTPSSKDLEQAKKQKQPNQDIINFLTNNLY